MSALLPARAAQNDQTQHERDQADRDENADSEQVSCGMKLDMAAIRADILPLPGVAEVHDLHIWTITSGMESSSGHVAIDSDANYEIVLDAVLALLRDKYDVSHATMQREPREFDESANAK